MKIIEHGKRGRKAPFDPFEHECDALVGFDGNECNGCGALLLIEEGDLHYWEIETDKFLASTDLIVFECADCLLTNSVKNVKYWPPALSKLPKWISREEKQRRNAAMDPY